MTIDRVRLWVDEPRHVAGQLRANGGGSLLSIPVRAGRPSRPDRAVRQEKSGAGIRGTLLFGEQDDTLPDA